MRCEYACELISARLDGEDIGVEADALEVHLGTCGACRRFEADAGAMHRAARLGKADDVPDLTPAILAAIGQVEDARRERAWWRQGVLGDVRLGLAAIALVQLALAIPALIFGEALVGGPDGAGAHVVRHLGAVEAGLAVGFLAAAWQPFRAQGLFPVVATLAVGLVAVAGFDLAAGRAAFPGEARHVLDLAGLALVWVLVHPHPGFRFTHA